MNTNFTVKFWGVRGSHPTPGPQTIFYGGNTACVLVQVAGQTIILDAGTGIIPLGRELAARSRQTGQPLRAVILFSHLHHDHTLGFPFFAPAHNPASQLYLYGPGASEQALEECLSHNQTPPVFPVTLREMSAAKDIHSLTETDSVVLGENGVRVTRGSAGGNSPSDVVVRLMKSYAHPGGVYAYRIEWRGRSLVYATDTEGYVGGDHRLAAFAKGTDLLIHDAQYSEEDYALKQGFGHSTPQMACEVARAAGAKRLALFHHDPAYDDESVHDLEEQAQALFSGVFQPARGWRLNYQRVGARQTETPRFLIGLPCPYLWEKGKIMLRMVDVHSDDTRNILSAIPLFDGLGLTELNWIAARAHRRVFPAGKSIFTAEQPGEAVYIILFGTVKIHSEQADGRDVIISILGAGDTVGEMSMIDSVGRSASAVTLEDSLLLWMDRSTFQQILKDYPPVALNLIKILSARVRLSDELIKALATLDVYGRVARQLLAFAEKYGHEEGESVLIPVALTQGDIADLVGASRKRVNQVMVFFREQEFVSVTAAGRIVVLNRAALAKYCR